MSEIVAVIMYIMFTNHTVPHQSFDNMIQCNAAREMLAASEITPLESSLCVPLFGNS